MTQIQQKEQIADSTRHPHSHSYADENRPAYTTAKSSEPPVSSMPNKFSGIRGNLTWRLVIHVTITTLITLVVLGVSIITVGYYQIHEAEVDQSRIIATNFQTFAKKQQEAGKLTDTEELMRAYLLQQTRYPSLGMLGFIGNDFRLYRRHYHQDIYNNKALIQEITTKFSTKKARMYPITVADTQYAVTVIPVQVIDSAPGYFVVVDRHSANIQPLIDNIRLYISLSFLVLILTIVATARTSFSLLHPLREMSQTLKSITSQQDLSKRLPGSGDSTLSEVSIQTNRMLERMQKMFQKEQDLLNDVGHEMRTPITVIRGHLELMNPNDSEDCRRTRKLCMDELDMMHRLTEALVTTAQIDRPNFAIPKSCDLTDLLLDTFESAERLSGNTWQIDNIADGRAVIDRQRITQALMQLCQNATKFAPPDSPIAIGACIGEEPMLRDQNGQILPDVQAVVAPLDKNLAPAVGLHETGSSKGTPKQLYFWVRDLGAGIEDRNQQRVFERFARVNHQIPGSGLGLTIVNAIAQSHGGTLSVKSRTGIGSIFIIKIPLQEYE